MASGTSQHRHPTRPMRFVAQTGNASGCLQPGIVKASIPCRWIRPSKTEPSRPRSVPLSDTSIGTRRQITSPCTTNLRNHCGVRRMSGNLPDRGRRVTVAPWHRKESNADAGRRWTQNTLMVPCGFKTVDYALPASSHRRSRGPVSSACSAWIALLHLR